MNAAETEVHAGGDSHLRGCEMPDEVLLERVRGGETAFYEVLVHRHNPRLRRAAARVLSNQADVEEVVQETHYNALRCIGQFSGRARFGTWLTQIAIHAALSRRRRANWGAWSTGYTDEIQTVVSVQPDPERQMQNKQCRKALESAVRALPELYRAVFVLRSVHELSTTEVAGLLEITEACARTRLHRAKTLLSDRLRGTWMPLRASGARLPASPFAQAMVRERNLAGDT